MKNLRLHIKKPTLRDKQARFNIIRLILSNIVRSLKKI